MNEIELRAQCMRLAAEIGGSIDQVIENAAKIYAFILGKATA